MPKAYGQVKGRKYPDSGVEISTVRPDATPIPEQPKDTRTKICRCCGKELPISEFYKVGICFDSHCKICRNLKKKTKVCTGCGKELPLTEFYRDGSARRKSRCKACTKAYEEERKAKS